MRPSLPCPRLELAPQHGPEWSVGILIDRPFDKASGQPKHFPTNHVRWFQPPGSSIQQPTDSQAAEAKGRHVEGDESGLSSALPVGLPADDTSRQRLYTEVAAVLKTAQLAVEHDHAGQHLEAVHAYSSARGDAMCGDAGAVHCGAVHCSEVAAPSTLCLSHPVHHNALP